MRPIDRDLRTEDKLQKELARAESIKDVQAIVDLKEKLKTLTALVCSFDKKNYYNIFLLIDIIKMKLEPLMATLNELQISSCKLLYVADVPMNYSDAVQLVSI